VKCEAEREPVLGNSTVISPVCESEETENRGVQTVGADSRN